MFQVLQKTRINTNFMQNKKVRNSIFVLFTHYCAPSSVWTYVYVCLCIQASKLRNLGGITSGSKGEENKKAGSVSFGEYLKYVFVMQEKK